jgi:hypothetical protein
MEGDFLEGQQLKIPPNPPLSKGGILNLMALGVRGGFKRLNFLRNLPHSISLCLVKEEGQPLNLMALSLRSLEGIRLKFVLTLINLPAFRVGVLRSFAYHPP